MCQEGEKKLSAAVCNQLTALVSPENEGKNWRVHRAPSVGVALRIPFSRLLKNEASLNIHSCKRVQPFPLIPQTQSWPMGSNAMKVFSGFKSSEMPLKHCLQMKPSPRDTFRKNEQPSPLSKRASPQAKNRGEERAEGELSHSVQNQIFRHQGLRKAGEGRFQRLPETCTLVLPSRLHLCAHIDLLSAEDTQRDVSRHSQQTLPELCIRYLPAAIGSQSLIPRDP